MFDGHVGGGSIYSVDVLVAGIVCLGLGIFILKLNPYLKISQVYMIAMCTVAIYASAMFLLHNSGSDSLAHLFTRYVMFSGVLMASAILYLSLYPPYEAQGSWVINKKQSFMALSAAAALAVVLLPNEVVNGEGGYWWSPNISTIVWLVILGLFCVPPILFLNEIWDRTEDERLRRHCTLVSMGLFFPFAFTVMDNFLAWSVMDMHNLLPIGLLTTGFIFAYTIINYKPFGAPQIKSDNDARKAKVAKVTLVSGHCDLVKAKRADASYRMFASEVENGSRGLLITNLHPQQVTERYGPVKAPVMWLSGQPGQDRLDPAALTIIQHTMVDFLQKGSNSVLLLDGLDYLISENQLDKVLKLIYAVRDAVVVSGSKFIVPIDPLAIDAKDLAFIEREFEVIDEPSN
ncbi:MAG: DUF835 domain-containing protein [Methanomassiliicoccus sp.]|nr:DUF835 domain-containing protein [Methanomassiliicoccus sp.]